MTTTDAQRGRILAAQVATFLFLGLYPAWAGQFLAAPEYPLPVSGVVVGDFNGDGNLDMVAPNYADNTFSVFMGRGDGTFRPPVSYAAGNNPLGIGVGDFNRDGKADVVITNNGEEYSTVSVFFGNGNGTFQPGVTYATGGAPAAVAVADLNADGILDLAVANEDFAVAVLLGNGDGR